MGSSPHVRFGSVRLASRNGPQAHFIAGLGRVPPGNGPEQYVGVKMRVIGINCLAVAVATSACSGDDNAASTSSTSPSTTTAVSVTTISTPTTTPVSPEPTAAPTAPPTATPITEPSTTTSSTTDQTNPTSPPPNTDDAAAFDWAAIVTELRQAEFELPRNPSLAAIDDVCAAVSECRSTTTPTIEFLLDNDLHVEGGAPFEIRSIEFQGTTDDIPLAEALGVVVIVRETVVDQGTVNLVDSEGNIVEAIPPDDARQPGDEISRAVILGRDTPDSEWRLSVIGDTA